MASIECGSDCVESLTQGGVKFTGFVSVFAHDMTARFLGSWRNRVLLFYPTVVLQKTKHAILI